MKHGKIVLILCVWGLILSGCGIAATGEKGVPDTEPAKTVPQVEPVLLDITVRENRNGELVFDISMDEYAESCNSFYEIDHGSPLFASASQWRCYSYDMGIHSDHETLCYYFSEDETVHSLPTITVYVPENGEGIQEITVNFDEHSYTEQTYELYEQMCFYTLKVFFPNFSDEAITDLCTEVVSLGSTGMFSSEEWYGYGAVPRVLFHKNGIGIYPYYAVGDWDHFCIIPVTSEVTAGFAQRGVLIYEIE